MRHSNNRSECSNEINMKAVSVIHEENWKDKMTLEELQASCDFYTMKIKEVEKSFSEFFHVIKS